MTDAQIATFVARIPPDVGEGVKEGVTKLLLLTQDPVAGPEIALMLQRAVQFPSWHDYLRSVGADAVEPKTAIGTEASGNHGHEGRPGKVGGSGPGKTDREKFLDLKTRWAQVNDELLHQLDTPTSPAALEKLDELKTIVKDMYRLDCDQGGDPGIGFPGGPRDIVIVGAGPGGLAAAVMGGTDGLDTLFIEANTTTGGQSKYSSRIENFPGFPCGVSGSVLADNMVQQAERVGAEGKLGVRVTGLTYDETTRMKTLTLSDGSVIQARSVILAGGVEMKKMDFSGVGSPNVVYQDSKALARMGAGKDVVVVGGSNGAAQAALGAVAGGATSVTVLSRSNVEKGMSDYQVVALKTNPKIKLVEHDEVGSLSGNVLTTKKGVHLDAHAVGLFIGGGPNLKWLTGVTLKEGKVAVNGNLETSMPGVFAVGDTRHGSIGRIGAAVGDGQMAERNANRFIRGIRD